MTARAAALRRIAHLYGVVEEMHSVALRQATASVDEADDVIRTERHAAFVAAEVGREALKTGEREAWFLAHTGQEISIDRTHRLEELKSTRVEVESSARMEYLASRIKTEQMVQVVTQMAERAAIKEGRRTQAVSDDRYAARRAWLASRRDR